MSLKKFGRELVGYGFGMAITKSVGLLSLPIVTGFYSQAQVGVVELALSLINLLVLLVTLGMDTGLTYFYWHNRDDQASRSGYVTSAICASLIFSAILSGALISSEALFDNLYFRSESDGFFLLFVASVVLQGLFMLVGKAIRIQREVLRYNFIIAINAVLFLLLLYAFLLKNVSIQAYFLAKASAFVPALAVAFFSIRSLLSSRPSCKFTEDLLRYSIPLVPFSLTVALLGVVDKFLVNYFLSNEDVGIYAVGAKLGMLISLPIAAFSMAYGPYAMSIKDIAGHKIAYARLFVIYLFVMLGMVLVLAAYDKEVLSILISGDHDYSESLPIIAPIALGLVVQSLFSQLGVGLNITRNNRFFFYGTILTVLLNIGLNILFIPVFGILAAAYAGLFSYIAVTIWIYVINNKYYPIPYSISGVGSVCFLFGISFFIVEYLSATNAGIRILTLLSYWLSAGAVVWRIAIRRR